MRARGNAVRIAAVLLVLAGAGGCAATAERSAGCASGPAVETVTGSGSAGTRCVETRRDRERAAAIGSTQQTGSRTTRVGVPRGFLIATLALALLVGAR